MLKDSSDTGGTPEPWWEGEGGTSGQWPLLGRSSVGIWLPVSRSCFSDCSRPGQGGDRRQLPGNSIEISRARDGAGCQEVQASEFSKSPAVSRRNFIIQENESLHGSSPLESGRTEPSLQGASCCNDPGLKRRPALLHPAQESCLKTWTWTAGSKELAGLRLLD